ncbi:MAG: hypothetical protein KDK97_01520 [Verrucomicrobiales bacterium]|nr:hypothetical protein [Verrucomicrobiales bacterium]MCP5559483.1 hypothetical protein [Verrucomicrobiaceae bacterium]
MSLRHVSLAVTAIIATAASAFAQATFPSPTLTSIYPLGGKSGTTVELSLKGTDLEGPRTLLFSPAPSKPIGIKTDGTKFTLTLPPDIGPGLFDVRFVGRFGVSNSRRFQIGTLNVVESTGKNLKAADAQLIEPDCTLNGVLKSSAPHWFSFNAKKSARLILTFQGEALATKTTLIGAVLDPQGRELARFRDGMADFTAPEAGTYQLNLHDLMFGSGDDYGYSLNITSGPVVFCATPDTTYGWHLDGGKLTPDLVVNGHGPLESSAKVSAAPINLPVIKEAPLTIGGAVTGWFPKDGAPAQFDLPFKTGDRFIIEVISQQLGLATAPYLLIENVKKDDKGTETLTTQAELTEPPTGQPVPSIKVPFLDPVYAYEAKADGLFRLSLSDPLNAANERRHPYTLRVRKADEATLDAAIAIEPTLPPVANARTLDLTSANVWRGGIAALEVWVPNRTALSPPIELTPSIAPPPGITFLNGYIGKGQSIGYIAFQAAADAPAGAVTLPQFPRTATSGWPVKDTNREQVFRRLSGPPAIGIVDRPAPAMVRSQQVQPYEVIAGSKVDLALDVVRHPDFTDLLKLKVLGLMDNTKSPEVTIAAKATTGKLTLDTKALKLTPGEYGFILQGPAKMKIRRNEEAVAAADAAAKQASTARDTTAKELATATAAAKTAPPAEKAAKDTAVKAATDKLKQADKAKTDTAAAAKALAAKDAPKDVTFIVWSNPIRLIVKEAPKK